MIGQNVGGPPAPGDSLNGSGGGPGGDGKPESESMVQWKQNNIKDGFVIVDEAQLSRLIKREPIEKYYRLEQEPFAKGLFASVRRCESLETGESYAAKFTSRHRYGDDCSAEIYHEIALLSLCGSAPRVIQIHDVFETQEEIIIVMEYAPGGDLQTIIDENLVPFESDVMSFVRQTVEGLEFLHRRRVAHLDIKPQNIVMMGEYPKCEIKLCDFEISRVILEGRDVRDMLGTPDYVAPEILHYDPITLAADMWSLGVTTYVLLTGYSPFGGETDQETFRNISRGEVDFPDDLFKDVSNEAVDFIKSLLIRNPRARLTAAACLKHPWLNKKEADGIADDVTANEPGNGEVGKPEVGPEKECHLCEGRQATGPRSLRKYLSKSREALFEKVVQKHNYINNNVNGYGNWRRGSKNHRFRKSRLCESQISLISKSRERLFSPDGFNCPSRSIEKLYGVRSLSKSQEVLDLYKNGGFLASQESLDNVVTELIKSGNLPNGREARDRKLVRATTTDLGILHRGHKAQGMNSYSSTTSLASVPAILDGDVGDDVTGPAFARMNSCREELLKCESPEETETEPFSSMSIAKRIEMLENRIQSLKESREGGKGAGRDGEEEEEPRFTVAQLITAFNRHQEIVTKTSLEVTMSAQEREVKIPPIIRYETKSTFPTGPTALRLFIPDIDLVSLPKKTVPKHKMRFPETPVDPPKKQETQRERKSGSGSGSSRSSSLGDRKRSPGGGSGNRKSTGPASRSVERSPSGSRKGCCGRQEHKSRQEGYKIVGDRTRTSSGVSYKIEFDSPVVKRKFGPRNMPTRGTISSNLKMRESVNKARRQ